MDEGSQAVDALVKVLPEGEASDILGRYTGIGGDNTSDWTLAGQLHLDRTAKLYWDGGPEYINEIATYLTQTGFNPFAIGVPVFAGGGAAKPGSVSEPVGVPFITPEMKANPYHPDWRAYAGGQARGVGADVVDGGEVKPILIYEDPRNLIPTQVKSEMSGSQIKRYTKDMLKNGFDENWPVDAWRNPATGRLELQDGHHRTEAAKRAGIDKIPVNVWE